jgi:hypothetical protein
MRAKNTSQAQPEIAVENKMDPAEAANPQAPTKALNSAGFSMYI